jgi:hypothetical protein
VIEDGFAFCNKDNVALLKCYFFSSKCEYGNRGIIYSVSNIKEPIAKVFTMGIKILAVDISYMGQSDLWMEFTLRLKNIG